MNLPAELAALLVPPDDFDARPVVEWLVSMAARAGASDLHLRPTEGKVEVLIRCDGVLEHRLDMPSAVHGRLLVGLKNMARVASYRSSVPQDGRLEVDGCEVRVASGPSHFGEKIIMRLVRQNGQIPTLGELGFQPAEQQRLERALLQPQGLLLATGPAGSGKTTTLYASLLWLLQRQTEGRLNVVTLEDPVELVVPQFTQTQVQAAAGMTFASGLRSLLRQDPDVLLVGEIRDAETAAAAVQASLTGHLVLSTIHARDSVGVIPRLLEMGIEPYLLCAALSGVVYQRLFRRLCGENSYRGRFAAAEILLLSESLRQAILDRAPLARLRELAEAEGMVPLRDSVAGRVRAGDTSMAELNRVLGA